MNLFLIAISFLCGNLCLQQFAALPSQYSLISLLILSGVSHFIFYKRYKYIYLLNIFILGFVYTAWYATNILSFSLPKNLETKTIQLKGDVESIPIVNEWGSSFIFSTLSPFHTHIRLNTDLPVKVGDQWQFYVRLKRLHGTQNPGGFDFEAWGLQNKIRATGYVLNNLPNQFIRSAWYHSPIDHVREYLKMQLKQHAPISPTSHWLAALMLGIREDIPATDWQILNVTGTNHLMAIAGLHIGMLAGFIYLIVNYLWRRFPRLTLSLAAQSVAAIAACGVTILYSALAGFSLPTQRAALMLNLFFICFLCRRYVNPWQIFGATMLLVLCVNPLNTLSESFYLSFGTVALIIYAMSGRLLATGWWWKWGRMQTVIGFGIIPLTLLFYQSASCIGLIANLIAIPWLGFLILPLCFFSVIALLVCPSWATFLLYVANKNLAGLWWILTYLSHIHMAVWCHAMPNLSIFMLSLIGIVILFLPAGIHARYIGLLCVLPVLFYQKPTAKLNEFSMTTLDVGQGLAIVVQTAKHVLIYDTGPALSPGNDAGTRVLVPFLRQENIKNIDRVVLSHGDNDHIGGLTTLINYFPIPEIETSVPQKIMQLTLNHLPHIPVTTCLAGEEWRWDGVTFRFFYPTLSQLNLGNDSSCVLRISNAKYSVLLSGDIEKAAEKTLVTEIQSTTILVAPHHGSKTSVWLPFIMKVQPKMVLYATGYKNRYRFPHQQVLEVYKKLNAQQFNTATTGAIFIYHDKHQLKIETDREKYKRYWFDS